MDYFPPATKRETSEHRPARINLTRLVALLQRSGLSGVRETQPKPCGETLTSQICSFRNQQFPEDSLSLGRLEARSHEPSSTTAQIE